MNQQNDIERCIYNKFLGKPLDHTFNEEESEFLRHIAHLSPMEAFEAILHDFELYKHTESIAFLQAMQEQILSFTSSRVVDIQHYLNWWDERGRLEAITVEMSDDTIEITTIHKAKGLERDIVLIPYSSWDMTPQPSLRPIVWAKMDDAHNDISESFPIVYGKSMKESVFSDEYYRELVMSHVDNIKLLYVAVTRASKELYMYVPTSLNTTSKPSDNINDVSKLILGVIKKICPEPKQVNKNGSKVELIYEYGSPTKCNVEDDTPTDSNDILLKEYVSHRPSVKVHYPTHRHMDESSDRSNKAITEGINLHRVFEGAITEEDLRESIRRMTLDCIIDKKQAQNLNDKITAALSNATIAQWFKPKWDDVKYEADIISQGSVRRPDRVMINGDKVVIVDYKFGDKRNKAYHKQMGEYMTLISKMGRYTNIEGYIWYIALGEIEKVEV
jgi:ATP-dependent exoDNAse (exonuclease V) beta subunit